MPHSLATATVDCPSTHTQAHNQHGLEALVNKQGTFIFPDDCASAQHEEHAQHKLVCECIPNETLPRLDALQNLHTSIHKCACPVNFEVDCIDLKKLNAIGAGFFGIVYKGVWQESTPVAIKELNCASAAYSPATIRSFEQEIEMMSTLRHPNIVYFIGACLEPESMCMVMEFLPRGSVGDILHGDKSLPSLAMRLRIALDVARGLNHLHKQSILHRDIKSENLLVTEDLHAKITDFGLSAYIKDSKTRPMYPLDMTLQGPEVLRSLEEADSKYMEYTEKSDIYSYGLLLWELYTAKILYEGMTAPEIVDGVLHSALRPVIPQDCPFLLSSLIQRCWNEDPSVRPTCPEIIQQLHLIIGDDNIVYS